MNVLDRTAAPFFPAGDELELDHTLSTETHRYRAIWILHGGRHENANAFRQRCLHFWPLHDLPDVRRSNFLLALRDHDEIHRELLARAANRIEGREKRGFRSLLVYCTTTNNDLAKSGLVHERR